MTEPKVKSVLSKTATCNKYLLHFYDSKDHVMIFL